MHAGDNRLAITTLSMADQRRRRGVSLLSFLFYNQEDGYPVRQEHLVRESPRGSAFVLEADENRAKTSRLLALHVYKQSLK